MNHDDYQGGRIKDPVLSSKYHQPEQDAPVNWEGLAVAPSSQSD